MEREREEGGSWEGGREGRESRVAEAVGTESSASCSSSSSATVHTSSLDNDDLPLSLIVKSQSGAVRSRRALECFMERRAARRVTRRSVVGGLWV